jgi:predicted dehydrogenase
MTDDRWPWRAGLVGHTGRGDYGHDLDLACGGMAELEVVALADPDPAGRERAAARSGAKRTYAEYETMLAEERLDLVVVASRRPDGHAAAIEAAVRSGAHVYTEKPFVKTLAEADRVLRLAEVASVKISVAHVSRAYASLARVRGLIERGAIGRLRFVRAYGKCDRRGGGQDFVVLGTHLLDLMRYFGGEVRWCHAHFTQDGRDAREEHALDGDEGVGPIFGNGLTAYYAFEDGVAGEFETLVAEDRGGSAFSLLLYGTGGALAIRSHGDRQMFVHPRAVPLPGDAPGWERLVLDGHEPEGPDDASARYVWSHQQLIRDLVTAATAGREPVASARDGAAALEMIVGAYQSHLSGSRVTFPLIERTHPLECTADVTAQVRGNFRCEGEK